MRLFWAATLGKIIGCQKKKNIAVHNYCLSHASLLFRKFFTPSLSLDVLIFFFVLSTLRPIQALQSLILLFHLASYNFSFLFHLHHSHFTLHYIFLFAFSSHSSMSLKYVFVFHLPFPLLLFPISSHLFLSTFSKLSSSPSPSTYFLKSLTHTHPSCPSPSNKLNPLPDLISHLG